MGEFTVTWMLSEQVPAFEFNSFTDSKHAGILPQIATKVNGILSPRLLSISERALNHNCPTRMKHLIQILIILSFGGLLLSCVNRIDITVNVTPTTDVNLKQYMGNWHEIARLPNKYEQGLERVTACYCLKKSGRITIRNHGYDAQGKQRVACGQAYRPNKAAAGHLRVSFVIPYYWFYGDYNILYVNKAHDLALVSGGDSKYLWILSKRTHISEAEKQDLLGIARARGFDTSRLIWPKVSNS